MHLGVPVVPEEYMMNRGWLKGSCSNFSSFDPLNSLMKSSNSTLHRKCYICIHCTILRNSNCPPLHMCIHVLFARNKIYFVKSLKNIRKKYLPRTGVPIRTSHPCE